LTDGERTSPTVPVLPKVVSSTFKLVVQAGPRAGRELVLTGIDPEVYVGSSPACALEVLDTRVSRRHLACEVQGARLHVRDVGSTNGSSVNGIAFSDVYLQGDEVLRIGDTNLLVLRLGQATPVILHPAGRFGNLIGASPQMRKLYPIFERLAETDMPVLIEGETGTGKEVLAEAIHTLGARADKPFVVFDCTAVPGTLMESALFGHAKGAFTGAHAARPGVFEQADGGTLFIDEIGDLDISIQPKLLRAIERSQTQRVGGSAWHTADVRVIAATRRNIEEAIQGGHFRDDLFYRLAVARIELPGLRNRTGDISVLARHFWASLGAAGEVPAAMLDTLERYGWPGNVRELYNAMVHSVRMRDLADLEGLRRRSNNVDARGAPTAGFDDTLTTFVRDAARKGAPYHDVRNGLIGQFDAAYVNAMLEQHNDNVASAAAAAGLGVRNFYLLRAKARGST